MDWALEHWSWLLVYSLLFLLYVGITIDLVLTRNTQRDVSAANADHQAAATKIEQVMSSIVTSQIEFARSVNKMQGAVDEMGNSIQPLTGYPAHIEATWEDVGARGRFLTDLGGMSIDMLEQQREEFNKALNTPLLTEPAAGSIADIMVDLDAWLTKQAEIERFLLTGHSRALGYQCRGD